MLPYELNLFLKDDFATQLVWLSWLDVVLQSVKSLVQFRAGHMPGLQIRSLVRAHARGNPSVFLTSVFLSISFSLFSPLSEIKNKIGFFLKMISLSLKCKK